MTERRLSKDWNAVQDNAIIMDAHIKTLAKTQTE